MKKVVILQKQIMHYRMPFYECLHEILKAHGVELRVVASVVDPASLKGYVSQHIPYIEIAPCLYLSSKIIYLLRLRKWINGASLVVLLQSNTFLNNYVFLFQRLFRRSPLLAYWGHGKNYQNDSSPFSCWVKQRLLCRVDWWFTYTDPAAKFVAEQGFPKERITAVQNAIDTTDLKRALGMITEVQKETFLEGVFSSVGYTRGKIGVYCTHLSSVKQVDFLLESLLVIHEKLPEFRMIIIGDGPKRNSVKEFCAENPWCVWVGAQYGNDKAKYLSVADVLLNPGMLGLSILDAFAAGIPVIVADNKIHSPEIAYLRNGENGLMTPDDPVAFSENVVVTLTDTKKMEQMKASARDSGEIFTIEKMAENFAQGISRCLGTSL